MSSLDMFVRTSKSSNLWQGVVEAIPILGKGFHMNVDDGKATYFWLDPWLVSTPLLPYALVDIEEGDMYRLMPSYWNEDQWTWVALHQVLPN